MGSFSGERWGEKMPCAQWNRKSPASVREVCADGGCPFMLCIAAREESSELTDHM